MATLTRERDGLPALAELMPVGDDVADELGVVHALGELVLDVITAPIARPQVGIGSARRLRVLTR